MSHTPTNRARFIAYLSCLLGSIGLVGTACSDSFDCKDSLTCMEPVGGGAGGEKSTSIPDESRSDGGATADVLTCDEGTFNCNNDPKDGCEVKGASLTIPSSPESRRPLRGEYTGSLHAKETAPVLRPTFVWSESQSGDYCGELHYELEVDDSCAPGELEDCEFKTPEVKAESTTAAYTPKEDLPVSEAQPVGAFYAWRVRACDEANCSGWSAPAPLNVGRTLQDVNGDGYAEALVQSNLGAEIYYGGVSPTQESALRLPAALEPRFVGDLNGDGFADMAFTQFAEEECGLQGYVVHLAFGGVKSKPPTIQALCRAGGSSSVFVYPRDVGDLNGDGFDDLAVTRDYSSLENSILVFAGGHKIASPATELETIHREYVLSSQHQIVAGRGDYTGDGFVDFLAGGYAGAGTNEIYVLNGQPILSREFDMVHRIEECSTLRWIESLGDLNQDQLDDWLLACGGPNSSVLGVIYGGTAESESFSDSFATESPISFVSPLLDFDGNGESEILIGDIEDSPLLWSFGEALTAASPRFARYGRGNRLDVADYNGDGRLDLIIGDGATITRALATTSFNVVPTALQVPSDAMQFNSLGY